MTEKSLFISSCTRRELARRRPWRRAVIGLPAWAGSGLFVAAVGVAAFVAGRGGL